MRYNQEDLKKGNISFERKREIVLQTVLSIQSRRFNLDVLYRALSLLVDILPKFYIFKKHEECDQRILNEKMFIAKVKRAINALKIENLIKKYHQREFLKKAILKFLRYLAKKYSKRLRLEAAFHNYIQYQQLALQCEVARKQSHRSTIKSYYPLWEFRKIFRPILEIKNKRKRTILDYIDKKCNQDNPDFVNEQLSAIFEADVQTPILSMRY